MHPNRKPGVSQATPEMELLRAMVSVEMSPWIALPSTYEYETWQLRELSTQEALPNCNIHDHHSVQHVYHVIWMFKEIGIDLKCSRVGMVWSH